MTSHARTGAALAMLLFAAGVAALLVHAIRAAAKGAWKRAMRRLYRQAMHQAARDAGLSPALTRTLRWDEVEPAPEPASPAPAWVTASTPSPAELTMWDGTPDTEGELTRRDLVRPLQDRRRPQ